MPTTTPSAGDFDKVFKLRLSREEWLKLESLAVANRRSINSEILTAIERYTTAETRRPRQ